MNIRYHLKKILLVVATTAMVTSAMTCEKLVDENGSMGNTGAAEIMDTGRYRVNTTVNTSSQQVQSLIDRLNGASDIQYTKNSFSAILKPKDLKKVHYLITLNIKYYMVWLCALLYK